MLSLFVEIVQSFILMQNIYKMDWIGGGKIFSAFFGQYGTFRNFLD